jgi:hypothetical protein
LQQVHDNSHITHGALAGNIKRFEHFNSKASVLEGIQPSLDYLSAQVDPSFQTFGQAGYYYLMISQHGAGEPLDEFGNRIFSSMSSRVPDGSLFPFAKMSTPTPTPATEPFTVIFPGSVVTCTKNLGKRKQDHRISDLRTGSIYLHFVCVSLSFWVERPWYSSCRNKKSHQCQKYRRQRRMDNS